MAEVVLDIARAAHGFSLADLQDVYDDGWSREGDNGCSGDGDACNDGWSREEDDGYSDDGYEEDVITTAMRRTLITNSSSRRPLAIILRYPSWRYILYTLLAISIL